MFSCRRKVVAARCSCFGCDLRQNQSGISDNASWARDCVMISSKQDDLTWVRHPFNRESVFSLGLVEVSINERCAGATKAPRLGGLHPQAVASLRRRTSNPKNASPRNAKVEPVSGTGATRAPEGGSVIVALKWVLPPLVS